MVHFEAMAGQIRLWRVTRVSSMCEPLRLHIFVFMLLSNYSYPFHAMFESIQFKCIYIWIHSLYAALMRPMCH